MARWAIILLLFLVQRPAAAALQAQLAPGSGGGDWALIAVRFPTVSGDVEVSVQDGRQGGSGPEVARRVPGNAGQVWIPLPLVAPAELTGAGSGWPVHIIVREPGGKMIEESQVELPLDAGAGRVIASDAVMGGLDGVALLSADDLLSGPPLLFAGCDDVYLSPDVQRRMTPARALALMATGVQLVVARGSEGDEAPAAGSGGLADLVWEPAMLEGMSVWMTPAQALARPVILEGGLARYGGGTDAAVGGATWPGRWVPLTIGPVAILWLLLARGMFRRRVSVALGGGLGMAVIGAGAILLLRAAPMQSAVLASWHEVKAGQAATGGVVLREEIQCCGTPVGGNLLLTAPAGEILFPVASTLKEYHGLRTLRLLLTGDDTTLTGALGAHQTLLYECRGAQVIGMVPGFPRNPAGERRLLDAFKLKSADAWWLHDGYVSRNSGDGGELLTTWAQNKPWAAGTMAWYEMRYQPGHRYLLGNAQGQLEFVDFGAVPTEPASQPR